MRMIKDIQEQDQDETGRIDMTPLIDIVFLLLVFFILTMTFMPDEKWLCSLLPTDRGGDPTPLMLESHDINISFYPTGAPQSDSTYELQDWYEKLDSIQQVTCRINGSLLQLDYNEDEEAQVEQIHTFITEQLAKYEQHLATRGNQDPIKVNCFSRLPWRYAIAGFDAVRAYEHGITQQESKVIAREFGFAPNELRDHRTDQLGSELYRLRSLR